MASFCLFKKPVNFLLVDEHLSYFFILFCTTLVCLGDVFLIRRETHYLEGRRYFPLNAFLTSSVSTQMFNLFDFFHPSSEHKKKENKKWVGLTVTCVC